MTQHLRTEGARPSSGALEAVRSWPSEAARAWTLDVVEHAATDETIEALVASGSAVREVAISDDLDLVLVYRRDRPQLPRPPIDVDLREYDEDDVPRKLAAGHDYLSWTVRFGHALFERDAWWTRLWMQWNGRLALPSSSEARKRAHKTKHQYEAMLAVGDGDAATELRVSMLTHLARAALSDCGKFPQSRPELAGQLRTIGERELADRLDEALAQRRG
ncbi:MAG: hypothetical protein F4X25_06285 [Chloroflexi bacterium]|nr:hypothetical protein [Chloroflexota bacterium]